MATDLEKLVVSLDADIRGLTNKLNRAGVEVEGFAKKADQVTKRAGKAIGDNLARHGGGSGSNVLSFAQKAEFGHIGKSIADELAAGSSPLRALQVEGGRIVQAFSEGPGGVGGTFKALGATLTGLLSPAALAAAGVLGIGAAAVYAYASFEEAESRIRLGLAGIGGASHATIADIRRLGEEIGRAQGVSASAGEDIALSIAKTGKVDVGNIGSVGQLAKGYAALTGSDLPTAGAALADIFADPATGAEKLNAVIGTLDGKTLGYIRTLAAQGDRQKAIAVLAAAVQPQLAAAAEKTSGWAKAWDAVADAAERAKNATGAAIGSVINGPTLEQQRDAIQAHIDAAKGSSNALQTQIDAVRNGGGDFSGFEGGVPAESGDVVPTLEKQKAAIEAQIAERDKLERKSADGKVAAALTVEASKIVKSYDEAGEAIRKLEADHEKLGTAIAGAISDPDQKIEGGIKAARDQYDGLGERIKALKDDYAAGGTAAASALREANFQSQIANATSYEAGLARVNHQYDELILNARHAGELSSIPSLEQARTTAIETYKSNASDKAEQQVQIPADFTNVVIGAEGNDPRKNPKSSASGIGQFLGGTFIEQYRKEFSELASTMNDAAILKMKSDVEVNKKLILAYARENAVALNNAGFAATAQNLYLAHNYGSGGAIKLLSAAPDASAPALLGGKVAAANPAVAGRTAAQVIAEAAARSQRYSAGGQSQQAAITAEQERQATVGKSAPDVAYLASITEQLNEARKDGTDVGRAFATADDLIKASADKLTPSLAAQRAEILKNAEQRKALAATDLSGRFQADLKDAYGALGRTSDEQAVYSQAKSAGATPGTADFDAYTQSLTQIQALTEAKTDLASPFHSVTAALIEGKSAADAMKQSITSLVEKFADKAEDSLLSGLFSAATSGGSSGGGLFSGIGHLLGLAGGGKVDGPGTSTSDSIPARLSKGEFVINAAATRRSLPLLQALNSGRRFAAGGYVGIAPIPAAVAARSGGLTVAYTHAPTHNITPAGGVTPEQMVAALDVYDKKAQRNVLSVIDQAQRRRYGGR